MHRVYRRAIAALVLAALLIAGVGFFLVEYFISGRSWATSTVNAHAFQYGLLTPLTVTDRAGEILFSSDAQGYDYAASPAVRRATLHAIGDPAGNIGTGLLRARRGDILGYNIFTGVSSFTKGENSLRLNISGELCAAALSALGGYKGTVAFCNYKTGELYCTVSSPSYDPVDPPLIEEGDERYEGVYIDRFRSAAFPPGSIFKLVTVQTALESNLGLENKTYTCSGTSVLAGQVITCSGHHGEQSFTEALTNSCNCAFAEMANLLGAERLKNTVRKIGVAAPVKMDGLNTAAGRFDLAGADDARVAWAAIGQDEDLINPCAYLRYITAIANDGVAVTPSLISPQGDTEQLMAPETAAQMAQMMRAAVTDTYGASTFKNLNVCAKSGTAQLDTGRANSVFCGFLDEDQCPLAFIVIAENAGAGQGRAMSVAAEVLLKAVELFG